MMQWIDGKPVGRIMPTRPDSRQQPKCLAMRLLEERKKNERYHKLVPPTPPPARLRECAFITDADGGKRVVGVYDGKDYGYILPTVPVKVLRASPGIQGWSIPDEPMTDEEITSALEDDRQRLRDMFPAEVRNLDGTEYKQRTRAEEDAHKGRMLPHVLR